MENSIIFVIIVIFYFCVVFPLQMRYYLLRRQRRLARLQTPGPDMSYSRNVTYVNSANTFNRPVGINRSTDGNTDLNGALSLEERREPINDYQPIFETVRMPPRDVDIAAARHQEAEHRQQIIDIQREVERNVAERNAAERQRRPYLNGPHMPDRLINSSTIRSSAFTINISSHITGASSTNYPHAPPLTPDRMQQSHKDDELPTYDQAVAFDSTTTSVTIRRY